MRRIPMQVRADGGVVIDGQDVGLPPCNDPGCSACDPVRDRMRAAAIAYVNRRARHARRREMVRR